MNKDYTQESHEESAPDIQYYRDQLPKLAKLAEKSSRLRFAFFQHILLVSASVLGILISLHENSSPCIYIRLVFLLSLLLFGLGILSTGIVVYDHSLLQEDLQKRYSEESQQALREERELSPLFAKKKKRTVFHEKWSLILLASGMIVLMVYAIVITVSPIR
jgi:hypothetical protein